MFTHAAEGKINFNFSEVILKNLCPEYFVKLRLLSGNQPQPVYLTSYLHQCSLSTEDWKLWFILVGKAAHPLLNQVIVALTTLYRSVEAVLST